MKVVIPSNRAEIKTLKYFPDAYIHVNDYDNLSRARNDLLKLFSNEDYILMLDDDICSVKKLAGDTGDNYLNVNDWEAMHEYHINLMQRYNAPMCGIGTRMQAWRNKGSLVKIFARTFSAYYLDMKLFKKHQWRFDEQIILFQDWDMTLQIFNSGLNQIVSFRYIMESGHWLDEGGVNRYRTPQMMADKTQLFLFKWRKYSPHIRPIVNPVSGMVEPRISYSKIMKMKGNKNA